MKKFTTLLIAVLLAFTSVFAVGCSNIPQDYKEAKSKLRKAGNLAVEVVDNLEDFLMGIYFLSEIFEDRDVGKVLDIYDGLLDELYDDYHTDFQKGIIRDWGDYDEEVVEFVFLGYFEDKNSAKAFYKDIEGYLEDLCACSIETSDWKVNDEFVYGVSGKVVYFGTEGVLEDLK